MHICLRLKAPFVRYASSLDCPAILGTCVDDVTAAYAAVCGADGRDGVCSVPRADIGHVLACTAAHPLTGIRVGIPLECHVEGISDATLSSWRDAAAALASAGATVVDISIPAISSSLAAYYVIVSAEASSNLARYDGARQRNEESVKVQQQAISGLDRAQTSTAFRASSFGAEVHSHAKLHFIPLFALLPLLPSVLLYGFSCNALVGATAHSCGNICAEQQTVLISLHESTAASVIVVQTSGRRIFYMPRNFAPHVGRATA